MRYVSARNTSSRPVPFRSGSGASRRARRSVPLPRTCAAAQQQEAVAHELPLQRSGESTGTACGRCRPSRGAATAASRVWRRSRPSNGSSARRIAMGGQQADRQHRTLPLPLRERPAAAGSAVRVQAESAVDELARVAAGPPKNPSDEALDPPDRPIRPGRDRIGEVESRPANRLVCAVRWCRDRKASRRPGTRKAWSCRIRSGRSARALRPGGWRTRHPTAPSAGRIVW